MQEVHVACPCCKNRRLFDADPTAVEGIIKIKCPIWVTSEVLPAIRRHGLYAMPYHYNALLCDLGDPFQISASISNLLRLGLLISTLGILNEGVAEQIEKEEYVQKRFELFSQKQGGARIAVSGDCDIISLDSYGRNFVDVCISKKVFREQVA